ncbi:HPr(Ser) kinase/phosphatase [Inmirania thermothiophila]|uniref:Hpr(Ser) kinase/phosphatase n=1 Tax=Inmirania thermothiophila TaxID=1750597 RepID=A0A3N1XSY8_9GAMM|nr:HPr(Ser) kinase/phosphatase [Inmirania thermothiophila]ROR29755.1 Hpr(Ser) kinase/phosphatase [Inmirania thermothiophila]
MTRRITAAQVVELLREPLRLTHIAGSDGRDRILEPAGPSYTAMALVGYLNPIRPPRVPVLGLHELERLCEAPGGPAAFLAGALGPETGFAVVADGCPAPAVLVEAAEAGGTPLFGSELPSPELISRLQYHLATLLAEQVTLHGVFLEVLGSGVLLTGEAGVGKSELALELISRGHRLVADDCPVFSRVAPDLLTGRSPEPGEGFLEVRGLGILNVRAMYGADAVKSARYLRLIVHLQPLDAVAPEAIDRLRGSVREREILGVRIPEVTLYVAPGRNLAVLVEAAVRQHLLARQGYDAAADLAAHQQRLLERGPR